MTKAVCFLLFFTLIFIFSNAQSIIFNPQPLPFFKINNSQSVTASCSYRVTIRTSCSSPRYSRDQISLAFGDAYGYQVYVPRLDGPSTATFEQCSVDIFQITGPCLYQVCYLYLYRSGYDGWKPETVEVYRYNFGAVTFYFNTHVPNNVWYGFNYCSGASSSKQAMKWYWHVFQVVFCFQCWKILFGSMW